MSLAALAGHIQAAGLGVAGTTLFIQFEIDKAQPGIWLRPTGGPVDPDLPGLRRTTFQAVVRSDTYPAGLTLAEALMTTLTIRQTAIDTAWFYEVRPRHEPIPFGRDDSGIHAFVLNFDAVWRRI